MSESLKATTIRNVGYNSIAKIIQLVVMAAANIILTRTLAPSDYGIVGFAGIFTAFLTQFSDIGVGSAAIQQKELGSRELYTAFTLKFFLGVVLFVLAFLCAPLAVYFFDNPAIVGVIRVLALNFVFNTFAIMPSILLTRSLNFKKIAFMNLIAGILNSITAVTLALLGFKYWSLVIAGMIMTISTVVLMNIFEPVRCRFAFDSDTAHRFIKFGTNIFLAGFVAFLIFNADNFIIGSQMGATNLGFYSLAFNWGSMACTMISGVALSTLLPAYSRLQDDRERLKKSYLKVLQFISFGGVLINMTLFVVSRDFLYLVLGHGTDKWLPCLLTLRILCFYGIARLLLEPVGQVVIALSRTEMLRKAALVVAAIELLFLYPSVHYYGIEGVALLVLVAYVSQYGLYFRVIRSELKIFPREIGSVVLPAVVGMLVLVPVFFVGEFSADVSHVHFIAKLGTCVFLYVVTYGVLTRWKLYKDFFLLASGRL